MSRSFVFTSESVTEGHPDKVCDFIADSILDAHLTQDAESRVACEVLCKNDYVILAGEITSKAEVDFDAVTRAAIREVGYTDRGAMFNAETVRIHQLIGVQSPEIARGVDREGELGAGDQAIVFGFATKETPELLPLPIYLAHRITRALAAARRSEAAPWLLSDAKAQITLCYEEGTPAEVTDIVISTHHSCGTAPEQIRAFVEEALVPQALGAWYRRGIRCYVNPAGEFSIGGPEADCGLTGRKIMVDTYGGYARHGGGSFSGKDATKIDRSGAYYARFVARMIVQEEIASSAEVQVAYAIGMAQPVAISVDTRGAGDDRVANLFIQQFDFRPAAIIESLDMRKPYYRSTTNYGHFGKPNLPWEA